MIFDVYRYLGFDTLNAEDLISVEEEAEPVSSPAAEKAAETVPAERPVGETRPASEAPADKRPAGREPVPLSQWKPFMTKLARFGRAATLATGLITLFALRGDHGPTRAEAAPEPAKIEYVAKSGGGSEQVEFRSEKEKSTRQLAAGETVDGVVRGMLGDSGLDEQTQKDLVKKVLVENDIADQWYKTLGSFDSTKLPIGTVIDVTVVNQRIHEVRQINDLKAGLELGQ